MSSPVQLACIECCQANGGELNKDVMAQTFIGVCQCCGEVKPLSNVNYWKNLGRVKLWSKKVNGLNVASIPDEKPPKVEGKFVNAPRTKASKLSTAADFS